MKTTVYYRSMEKSLTVEEAIRNNIFTMLDKFDRVKFGDTVVRITRLKGREVFRYPKFLCEVILNFGHKKIIIKKKSIDVKTSIIESRFALEKTLRRKLKKEIQHRNHVTHLAA